MKKVAYCAAVIALAALVASPSFAGTPSAKFAAQVSSIALISPATVGNTGWAKVLETTIKTPNKKDLLIAEEPYRREVIERRQT